MQLVKSTLPTKLAFDALSLESNEFKMNTHFVSEEFFPNL
jgi:hypothetical protein